MWGGEEDCGHELDWLYDERRLSTSGMTEKQVTNRGADGSGFVAINATCVRCGAWRGAYGLEPSVQMYVEHTVGILREIRRVLRPDGAVFWNLGDSYAGGASRGDSPPSGKQATNHGTDFLRGVTDTRSATNGALKPKDLCLIPARVALAAQADGWWVRSDIIWAKPNPMPESCRGRPTDSYEHILMLTKSARYFWDADAVREPQTGNAHSRGSEASNESYQEARDSYHGFRSPSVEVPGGRNLRNVWVFPTQPYSGAHFATFPEEIPRRCILAASKPRDIILDPFGGSGTTGLVAQELGRRFVLLDLGYSGPYAELAAKRLSQEVLEF